MFFKLYCDDVWLDVVYEIFSFTILFLMGAGVVDTQFMQMSAAFQSRAGCVFLEFIIIIISSSIVSSNFSLHCSADSFPISLSYRRCGVGLSNAMWLVLHEGQQFLSTTCHLTSSANRCSVRHLEGSMMVLQ